MNYPFPGNPVVVQKFFLSPPISNPAYHGLGQYIGQVSLLSLTRWLS